MTTTLYRSQTDKMLGGVCGGLSDYLGIDTTIIRLFFVLLALSSGIGVLIYIALWILLPEESQAFTEKSWEENLQAGADEIADRARTIGEDLRQAIHRPNPQTGLIIGTALIMLGVTLFLRNLHIPWLWWLDLDILWPLLLIVAGAALLIRRTKGA